MFFFFFQVLELDDQGGTGKLTCLGPDVLAEYQQVQYTVPPNVWFGAFPANDVEISDNMEVFKLPSRDPELHFSLVGCTCAPGFQFEDFELAKRSELISRFPAFQSLITFLTLPDWVGSYIYISTSLQVFDSDLNKELTMKVSFGTLCMCSSSLLLSLWKYIHY